MDSYDYLVITLSITLAIFLVLAIIATVLLIRVLKRVNSIAEKADIVVANIEEASENFKKVAGPAAAVQALINLLKRK